MAKPYNHRRAENEYKKWKEKDERFMEKNGMSVEDFLNSITSIAFAQSLEEFGFEMQMIIFLMYRGYSARELSKITGISEWTICRRLAKLNYAYQIRKTNK